MNKICKNCSENFEITDGDLAFYDEVSPLIGGVKINIPSPTFCPNCRSQRRMSYRNERTLYRRKCDGTGKDILSVFSEDKKYKIYDPEFWYSDKWDAKNYGRDFDFNRTFFEQFLELTKSVPQLARSVVNCQNSDYVNQAGYLKDSYLVFEADYSESCIYGNYIQKCKNCIDNLAIFMCELCYECIACQNCYNLKFSHNCNNCSDSYFLQDCIGCKNCFGCVNMRNKEYCFYNEQLSKDTYLEKIKNLGLDKFSIIENEKKKFKEFASKFPKKLYHGSNNENSTGDYISNTQNCNDCFDVNKAQDSRFIVNARNIKKTYDLTVFGAESGVDYCYDNHELGDGVRNAYFSDQLWGGCYNIFYSKLCPLSSHDLFGCVGMTHAEYCILNKQYTKYEYEKLVVQIIEHMKKTGEWGEFFPAQNSPFAYNETIAQDYFPISKEVAVQKNLKWKDEESRIFEGEKVVFKESITEIRDEIIKQVLVCEVTGKPYKITQQELKFYKEMNLPIPRKHPDQRHKERMAMRNPRKLWDRNCAKCSNQIQTTYSPEMPDIVYCEACYLAEVY